MEKAVAALGCSLRRAVGLRKRGLPCQRAALFGEEFSSLRSLCQTLNCLELLLCKSHSRLLPCQKHRWLITMNMALCRPKGTNVVFLVPLLFLACRSEHQTCIALHTATQSPTSGTATGFTSKERLIAKKNL